jgi:hypothetical protein
MAEVSAGVAVYGEGRKRLFGRAGYVYMCTDEFAACGPPVTDMAVAVWYCGTDCSCCVGLTNSLTHYSAVLVFPTQ